jgi:hypothetical protein
MKLRIRGNSIRLRLTKSEVEQLGQAGAVEDAVAFGPASAGFRYELRTTAELDTTRAAFENSCLSILIPVGDAENWIGSERIGIEAMQPVGSDEFLRILVEKDFACLAEREGEDESDAFPNPIAAANC